VERNCSPEAREAYVNVRSVSLNKKNITPEYKSTVNNRTLLNGDCLEKLKELPDESIDLICTDPPYGYGFMNKDWDKAVVSVDVWRECLRVLKAGSFAFVMSAPRQDVLSHMIVNLSDAGFRTDFTSMYWAYASGFPKAANISKLVDKKLGCKREIIKERRISDNSPSWESNNGMLGIGEQNFDITKPSSEQAKKLDGSYAGFQPKPALEVILVCMKPLSEKAYVDQAMSNGKGVTWLDDCRIPYKDDSLSESSRYGSCGIQHTEQEYGFKKLENNRIASDKGRFPSNLLVSDNSLDTGKKTKSIRTETANGFGVAKNTFGINGNSGTVNYERGYDDEGDFSRYFSLDNWESQFIITPKPSKSEKNEGLSKFMENTDQYGGKFLGTGKLSCVDDGRKTPIDNPYLRGKTERQNTHPTVKPISLFKYLITLGSRPNDFVLDPFMGSGTTAIASELISRNWIGIERESEYCEIINARVSKYLNERLEAFTN
jgi:DNA modification methylase